jgi:methionyl-tRNA formyltransferase
MQIKRVIFFGTPEFAVPSLQKLAKSRFKPLLVVTQPDKEQGRRLKIIPPPIKVIAEENGIETIQPESLKGDVIFKTLSKYDPDIIITVAYGGILPKKVLSLPRLGCINLHPSMLPKYRGATPMNQALFEGDTVTGVTVFRMEAKMDSGPILLQKEFSIDEQDNYSTLSNRLSNEGGELLLNTLSLLEKGSVAPIEQDHSKATYCYKLKKEDMIIDWSEEAVKILGLIRGLSVQPGAMTYFRDRMIKILEAELIDKETNDQPGTFIEVEKSKDGGIIVACGDKLLRIKKLQPAGKKIMSAFEYNLGARMKEGERFFKCLP